MLESVSASGVLVWLNVALWSLLLVVYGLLERGRTWLRVALLLCFIGIWQMSVRALLVLLLGEHYWGRDVLLILGRVEITVSGAILFVMVTHMHWADIAEARARRRHSERQAPSAPPSVSQDI